MNQAMMLGRYLQQRPSLVRVTTSLGRFLRQRLGRMRRNQKVYRLPRSRPRWGGGDHFDTDAARTAGNEQPRRRAKRHKPSLCLGLWPRSRGRGPEDIVGQLRQHHRCKAYWAGNQAPPRGRFGVLRPRGSLVSASREGPAEKGTLRNPNLVAGATASERHSVKLVRENPPSQWKPVFPISPSVAIANATLAQQIHGVRAQPREEELIRWALQATMLLGGARGGTLGADKRAQGRS